MQLSFTSLRIHKYALWQLFFQVRDLVKNAKKQRGLQTRYPSGPIWDFQVNFENYKWKLHRSAWIWFFFVSLGFLVREISGVKIKNEYLV